METDQINFLPGCSFPKMPEWFFIKMINIKHKASAYKKVFFINDPKLTWWVGGRQ